jgi:SAM-dependent methyltransferase
MSTSQKHYESLLAQHYTWMCGGYEENVARAKAFFEAAGLLPRLDGKALDLGCGPGFGAAALAMLGFEVLAVDLSQVLLAELKSRCAGLKVTGVLSDMRDVSALSSQGPFEVVICAGDSLTHLSSEEDAGQMIQDVYDVMESGGTFVISFRDLTSELVGTDRIIPLRMDDDRLMTTFLEYHPHHVTVNDLIFSKTSDGKWQTQKSAYQKLRLGSGVVKEMLRKSGFEHINTSRDRGFVIVIARV